MKLAIAAAGLALWAWRDPYTLAWATPEAWVLALGLAGLPAPLWGRGLRRLFAGLPVRLVQHRRIFGGYDNLVQRLGPVGRLIRAALHAAERTPLSVLGLSHFVVVERVVSG